MTNRHAWIEFINRIFSTDVSEAEAIFVHGWGDLDNELRSFVVEEYQRLNPKYVVLNGEPHYEGDDHVGIDWWREGLIAAGMPAEKIHSVLPAHQTLEEAQGFMSFAIEHAVKKAVVISVPPHTPRAFLTNLGVALEKKYPISLYPRTVKGIDWETEINIQGIIPGSVAEKTSRIGRMVSEMLRIMDYRARYEVDPTNFTIASIEEGLDHLRGLK